MGAVCAVRGMGAAATLERGRGFGQGHGQGRGQNRGIGRGNTFQ